ncbi:MAG: UPF0235 protein [Hyphococcus sp.]|nr:MAG: UPF0235 protein [Marinicaulis sp.]
MAQADFFSITEIGLKLFVRATPGAAKNEILGIWQSADGERRLAIKVTAPPDKGKANIAIIKLLASETGLAKSCFSIVAGETARLKTIEIPGDAETLTMLMKRLAGE